ncbi:MAG: Acetylglutamate/acetylaminoadipate kinase [Methanomassiliicoccales archaeon PtaU1.Bin124]|nr:MAG: Acetylglutamate/acetylaminoadipate kinase [Methanomassiliicoccales archaeon PtaU1.Bin124]
MSERMVHYPCAGSLHGRQVVIKFGGSSIDEDSLKRFASDINEFVKLGVRPVIVHGGGPEITEEMKRRGLPVRKVLGLRITDDATLEVAKGVLTRINDQIVRALQSAGIRSIGMAGTECNTVICHKMAPVKGKDEKGSPIEADLGWVGEPEKVDPRLLLNLTSRGFVPVMFTICADAEGNLMNVNADTAAAHVAVGVKAADLLLVTDVPGLMRVFGDPSTIIPEIRTSEFQSLVNDGVVKDGMIPKLEACVMAVKGGVGAAHMVDGKDADAIVGQLLAGKNHGTRIIS